MRQIAPVMLVSVLFVFSAEPAAAKGDLQKRVDQLSQRVKQLEDAAPQARRVAAIAVLFLFGAFCALWAQNTNRNPWLWFFLGCFFHVSSVLVLLAKNDDERRQARGEPDATGSLVGTAIIFGLLLVVPMAAVVYFMLKG
jgi:hypothetical protein